MFGTTDNLRGEVIGVVTKPQSSDQFVVYYDDANFTYIIKQVGQRSACATGTATTTQEALRLATDYLTK